MIEATAINATDAEDATVLPVVVSRVRASGRGLLAKTFGFEGGQLTKRAAVTMSRGKVITQPVAGLRGLADLINDLQHNEAIILGQLRDAERHGEWVNVASAATARQGEITRSKDRFNFADGQPAFLLIDVDTGSAPPDVLARIDAMGGPAAALLEIVDEFRADREDVGFLLRPSSSSGIVLPDGTPAPSSGGAHCFVVAQDGGLSKDLLEALHRRAWLRGLGWTFISKSGALLDRSIVDVSVASPERLVFEAPPVLRDGVTRPAASMVLKAGRALRQFHETDDERERASDLIAADRDRLRGRAAEVATEHRELLAERLSKAEGHSIERAREIVAARALGRLLHDDDVLESSTGPVRVADLLNANKRRPLADPTEGLAYGSSTAYFLPGDERRDPVVVSHAHGQTTVYKFARFTFPDRDPDPEGVTRPTMTADEAAEGLKPVVGGFYPKAETKAAATLLERAVEARVSFASAAPAEEQDAVARAAEGRGGPTLSDITEDDMRTAIHFPPGPPPHELILADLGIGKTHTVISGAVSFVSEPRDGMPPRRVGFIVNDHTLAEDVAERFNSISPKVASVWRGLEQEDPNNPGHLMCRRSEDLNVWRLSGGSRKDMCRSCPFGPALEDVSRRCGYITQRTDAPVTVLAGPSALSERPPGALSRKMRLTANDGERKTVTFPAFDMAIVDETRATSWVGGLGPKPVIAELGIAAGKVRPPNVDLTDARGWDANDWLAFDDRMARLHDMMNRAVDGIQHGKIRRITYAELRLVFPVPRPPFDEDDGWSGLRKKLNDLRMEVDRDLAPLTGSQLSDEVSAFRTWNDRVKMLQLICLAADQCERARKEDGSAFRDNDEAVLLSACSNKDGKTGIRLRWRKDIHKIWRDMPLLILDATASVDLLRAFLPNLKVVADCRAKIPAGVTVLQVSDKLPSSSGWAVADTTDKARNTTSRNNAAKLLRTLEVIAAATAHEGGVGLVGQMALVDELRRQWGRSPFGMPQGVVLGHYNAIRGRDDFKGVRVFIDLGRASPVPGEAEAIAETIWCRPVQRIPAQQDANARAWYERGQGRYHIMSEAAGGGVVPAPKSESHPDPLVEDIRRQVVDAELDQADHRSRALRRDESRPLLQIRATALPSDRLIVDRLIKLEDVLPFSVFDLIALRGLIVPTGHSNHGGLELLALAVTRAEHEAALDGEEVEIVTAKAVRLRLDTLKINHGNWLKRHSDVSYGKRANCHKFQETSAHFNELLPEIASLGVEQLLDGSTFSEWRVQLAPGSAHRPRALINCQPQDEPAARALLVALLGVDPYLVEPVTDGAAADQQPQPKRPRGRPRKSNTSTQGE